MEMYFLFLFLLAFAFMLALFLGHAIGLPAFFVCVVVLSFGCLLLNVCLKRAEGPRLPREEGLPKYASFPVVTV